ncbi:hypothetical protein DV738_g1454, partial [Chaetothyriales sp. CBS 135597]
MKEEKSPQRSPAADSTTPSTRSGHPPGTPKRRFGSIMQLDPVLFPRRAGADKMTGSAPISPPRRRSSLAFSKVFTCSSPARDDSSELDSPRNTVSLPLGSPPSVSRKGLPASVHRHSITPGHVARLQQKLLQSAKAALRVDMAFAASPTGSIGARLPPDTLARPSPRIREMTASAAVTPSRIGWRFSVAPNAIAGFDQDVREPVEGYLPTMPNNLPSVALDDSELVGDEPVSSGFSSPIVSQVADTALDTLPALPSSPPMADSVDHDQTGLFGTTHTDTELEEPMTGLKVSPDAESSGSAGSALEESPTVAHVERMSVSAIESGSMVSPSNTPIVLSETAEAAAESARAKRGLLRNLFARRESRDNTTPREQAHDSSESSKSSGISCPDPGLHRLIAGGGCPDPSVHLKYPSPLALQHGLPVTPEAVMGWSPYTPGAMQGGWYPAPPIPFHRATATGSPMPFARARPRQYASHEADMAYSRPPARPNSSSHRRGPVMENRHRPESPAAKVGGQSSAPVNRIRDSYRTDTLTPLARPPSRFRKTGIGAFSSGGVNRYYGGEVWPDGRVPGHRGPTRARSRMTMHDNLQFRSSPPRPAQRMQSPHKRRRPREFEDESLVIGGEGDDLQVRIDKDEGLMEIDDETRAAVRMSVWGSDVPEALQNGVNGLRELSPNVTMWRKGMRQPSKKRRPSYWDGDLKQVRESPAGGRGGMRPGVCTDAAMGDASEGVVQHGGPERRVCTSPAKAEIENVTEQAGLIEMEIDHSS